MRIRTCAWLLAGLLWGASAQAGVVTSAVAVTPAGACSTGFVLDRTIDQSGLTVGYTSGATDFASYVLSGPRHEGSNGPQNYSCSFDPVPADVDYDLGATLGILELGFWQYPFESSGPLFDFQVFTSNDPGFGASTLVGSFTAVADGTGLGAPGTALQVFDLLDTDARYLRRRVQTFSGAGWGWARSPL